MRALAIGAAILVGAAGMTATNVAPAQADAASPSVREAARLKYNPPRNWIRHYLGDDRYKLMGGTWKVVSTETDTMYYPAWAPEMLRQSNGIVIGFPSAAAAEEAGYKRSKYPMESPLLGLTGRPQPAPPVAPSAGVPGSPLGGFSLPAGGQAALNQGQARRIVLADGVSSTVLPQGWSHATHSVSGARTGAAEQKMDFFFPGLPDPNVMTNPRNVRFVVLGSAVLPGMNAEAMFNVRTMQQMNRRVQRALESNGRVNTRTNAMMASNNMRGARFGNISGISMSVPIPEFGRTVPIALGGRGSKAFFMIDTSRGAKGSRQIISGFRGR